MSRPNRLGQQCRKKLSCAYVASSLQFGGLVEIGRRLQRCCKEIRSTHSKLYLPQLAYGERNDSRAPTRLFFNSPADHLDLQKRNRIQVVRYPQMILPAGYRLRLDEFQNLLLSTQLAQLKINQSRSNSCRAWSSVSHVADPPGCGRTTLAPDPPEITLTGTPSSWDPAQTTISAC